MKRIISIFMTLVLCVGLFAALGVSASADVDTELRTVTFCGSNFDPSDHSWISTASLGDVTISGHYDDPYWRLNSSGSNHEFNVSVPDNCQLIKLDFTLNRSCRWPDVKPDGNVAKVGIDHLVVSYAPEDNVHSMKLSGADELQAVEELTVQYLASSTDNVKFGSDLQSGTLTVSGSGSIPENTFAMMSGIDTVIIKDGVTGIGDGAFAGSGITSVQIPGSVEYIGKNAFDGCVDLSSVTIDDGNLKTIGKQAFFQCYKLSEITIPASVESIGSKAFANSALEKIVFLGDCKIGEDAFYECDQYHALTVVIPASWTQGTDELYGAVYYYGLNYVISGTGSALSQGNLWIVIAVAVLAIGTVAALVVKKKKTSNS